MSVKSIVNVEGESGASGSVKVSFNKETSGWQAIGLLETALIFLKQEYATSAHQLAQESVETTSPPVISE